MIDIEHVYQTFGNRQILKDVCLKIRSGETTVILGASGSGKSTLLKLIIGLLQPTQGKVIVDGQDMGSLSEKELNQARQNMGMVFQYSALFDSMNVKENIAFGPRMHLHLSEEEVNQIVAEKLHLVGLDGMEEIMPANLSGGMKKRVSLARAIAMEPKIILYDEPTAGLDPIRSADIGLLIKSMQKVFHATSVVVTHDLRLADTVADQMAFLYKGSFLAVGTPEFLHQSKDLRVRQFMEGLPSGSVINGEGEIL